MRMGEQGVPTLEQWLSQEAAAVRDAAVAASALATLASTEGEVEDGVDGGGSGARGMAGFRLGVDPWLVSAGTARSLTAKLTESGGSLAPISG